MVERTLILSNEDMEGLVTIQECIDSIGRAYLELGQGVAQELPRRRIYFPRQELKDHYYWFNEMAGIVPGMNTMALRVDSATINVTTKRGNARFGFPGPFSGLVYLYDIRSNELIAIIQDFYLNPIRVAATSAIVTKRLARDDAKLMGIFGSGTQAILQVEHNCAVTNIEEVRVYSTRKERRESIARQMNEVVKAKVVAVDDPRQAVEGCDIVTTATNSNEPVFKGEWLEPGTHVNTMLGSDGFLSRRETDDTTVRRSDLIVVNSKESVKLDKQPELYPALKRGELSWDDIYDIGELLTRRRIHGRSSASQITYHNNNVGMGIQFAALGRLVYEKAKEHKRGTEIDGRVFMQFDENLRAVRDRSFLRK